MKYVAPYRLFEATRLNLPDQQNMILSYAVRQKYKEATRDLIDKGYNAQGAMVEAVRDMDIELVRELLTLGAKPDVDAVEAFGQNFFVGDKTAEKDDMVQLFQAHKADFKPVLRAYLQSHYLRVKGDQDPENFSELKANCEWLIALGGDLNYDVGGDGDERSVLFTCVRKGLSRIGFYLLQQGMRLMDYDQRWPFFRRVMQSMIGDVQWRKLIKSYDFQSWLIEHRPNDFRALIDAGIPVLKQIKQEHAAYFEGSEMGFFVKD